MRRLPRPRQSESIAGKTTPFDQPPNSQSLSDAVIRDVLQRVWTPAHRTMRSVESTTVAHRDQQPKPPATAVLDTLERITRPIEISPGQQELPAIPARNTKTSLSGEEIMQLITADDTGNGTQSGYLANASEALDKERRRLNQIQYRKKQQAHIESVEEYVQTLQQEIQCLAQRQQNAVIGPPEALHTFALSFLRKSITSDVMDGPMRGPEVVLTYWRLFSLSFDDICVETERLDKRVESNTLVVTTATSVTISKDTLRLVFPHLDSNKKGLLELRYGSERRSQSDMLTRMLSLLGNVVDVSRVFEGALLTPECRWVTRGRTH
ncbi:hypothetical protein PC116_g9469 [Phytophthora cactorum]|nr:hypothetical protein PC116_g9469 [Phytophthora cactorum]